MRDAQQQEQQQRQQQQQQEQPHQNTIRRPFAAERKAAAQVQATDLLMVLEDVGADPEVKKAKLAEVLSQAWGDATQAF